MKAIILSAGQGKRLLPLTESQPKCLLDLGEGYSALSWQLTQLEKAGIDETIVVTGFQTEAVEKEIRNYSGQMTVRTLFNPFYKVADNLSSVWIARHEMTEDFIILNGDTMFTYNVAEKLLKADGDIILNIAVKDQYDDDDMKVILDGSQLQRVGKKLDRKDVNGEFIGMMKFTGKGIPLFINAMDNAIRAEDGLKVWYLSVLDKLAQKGHVGFCEISQTDWCEIDFPEDYEAACKFVQQKTMGAHSVNLAEAV